MFLYASGCSMTFGSEMAHENDHYVLAVPELNQYRLDHAWPGVLTRLLGFDGHHNDGLGGSANEGILRRTMTWVLRDWPKQERPNTDLFVQVNWSQITRWEFFHGGNIDAVFLNQEPGILAERPAYFQRFWKRFQDLAYSPWELWIKFTNQVAILQAFLKHRDIRYGMSYGVESPISMIMPASGSKEWAEDFYKLYKSTSLIDRHRFNGMLNENSGMCAVMSDAGITHEHTAPRGHPYADGHEVWAKHLAAWIIEKDLLT